MKRVLVIDDDAPTRLLCRVLLEEEGYQVTEAADGAEGVLRFTERPADAVLCDVYMPEMDGLETIEHLTSEFLGVRIVAMSAGFPEQHALTALCKRLGAVTSLAKPFTRGELLRAVRAAVDDTAVA